MENHKTTKPAFNHVRPSSARQPIAIYGHHDGPLLVVFGSSLPSSTKQQKKKNVKVGPL